MATRREGGAMNEASDASAAPAAPASQRTQIAAAITIACGPLLWLCYAAWRASYLAFGPEQGEAAGVAWALAHGSRVYRDVHASDGPVVYELHALVQWLGGIDARAWRVFELGVSAAVFAFVSAAVARVGQVEVGGGRGQGQVGWGGVGLQVLWGAAGAVLLLGQYLSLFGHAELGTAASLGCWFVFKAYACELYARSKPSRSTRYLRCGAGLASALGCFVLPGGVLYALLLAATVACAPRDAKGSRRGALAMFALGFGFGVATQLAFLLAYASVSGFVHEVLGALQWGQLRHPLALGARVFGSPRAALLPLPIALSLVAFSLHGLGYRARGSLALCALPWFALAATVLDADFVHRLQPLTASAGLLVLWITLRTACVTPDASARQNPTAPLWPLALAGLAAVQTAGLLIASANLHADWSPALGGSRALRVQPAFLKRFDRPDFPLAALAEAANYVKQHTRRTDRIALHGVNPYLLALAERPNADAEGDATVHAFGDEAALRELERAGDAGLVWVRRYPNRVRFGSLVLRLK